MERIREPLYEIIWKGKDVTQKINDYLISITYTDHLHGESDEIDVTFDDRGDKWKSAWYPQKGDPLEVSIGLKEGESEKWIKAGIFRVDEINFTGAPDTVSVRGLSAYITEPLRQKKTKSWEKVKLSHVISELALQNNLKAYIAISQDVTFERLDQKEKSDLTFIKELANKYGYISKIDSEQLIFASPEELEALNPVVTIRRGDGYLISYDLQDMAHGTYYACEVTYWDPKRKKVLKHVERAQGITSGNILKISERVENRQQAIRRARAELKRCNEKERSGEIVCLGDPYLIAGVNISLEGFYHLSGKYIIEEATHSITKPQGYITICKVRRVEEYIEKMKEKKR